ncbi:ABC transporter permease [Paenibacillus arenilitoris]|uniref:ABC transporter permease n=1 Tax=Paenibacillus arenilitoris TaxID=2772299 RepID=A0A927CFI4_9BACL|nr:ABC transporter permease [Paenibacillus arenilitoris]MBD2867134.1 ABC transporter permease [Paenibacillus arenilitoris]
MRVLSTTKFTMLRLVRNYIGLLLLLIVPIVMLTIFSLILSGMTNEEGNPYFNETALTMVLTFQLFGGSSVMHYLNYDLFTLNRERMFVAPFNRTMYALSIMIFGSIFSVLLGIVLMIYSQYVLGMVWNNWAWTIYLITLMSVLSSIVCVIFTCVVKKFKLAGRLSEIYGVGFVMLAGLFFPMPQNAVFDFLGSYGNPLTLSIGAVRAGGNGNWAEAWLQANIVLAAIVTLFLVMIVVGRKRLK